MRSMRRLNLVPALALALGAVWIFGASAASAYAPMVTIIDNDAPIPSRGIEAGTGYWGYGPDQLVVKKGEQVLFVNPATNKTEHSVTSISTGPDGAFSGALAAGTKFDSSPTRP